MPTTIGVVTLNTPEYKIFDLLPLENDAVDTETALTFVGAGMSNLSAAPQMFWVQETSDQAVEGNYTITTEIALNAVTTTGFNVVKVSAGAATGFRHRFRVYMMTKRAFGV